jgi:hypothetical protein
MSLHTPVVFKCRLAYQKDIRCVSVWPAGCTQIYIYDVNTLGENLIINYKGKTGTSVEVIQEGV